MTSCRTICCLVLGTAGVTMLWGLTGCEEGDLSGAEFRIDPSQVVLDAPGASVVLRAVGGEEPLTWTNTDPSMGTLSGEGRTVTYTRGAARGATTIRVRDAQQWTAEATIIQDSPTGGLEISPSSVTLPGNQDKVVFTATGGTKPYHWSVGIGSRGKINVYGSNQAIYTRLSEGDNTVIVADRSGHVALANVVQPAAAPLSISPPSASVAATNGTQVFTAVGGSGTYSWSVLSPSSGFLSHPTGSSTVYTSIGPGTDIIALHDGFTTVFATVQKQ